MRFKIFKTLLTASCFVLPLPLVPWNVVLSPDSVDQPVSAQTSKIIALTEQADTHVAENLNMQRIVFDLASYEIDGPTLLQRQIERGLVKQIRRKTPRDQSFEGLRDIIADSSDAEIKSFLPIVENLERQLMDHNPNKPSSYTEDLIADLTPITVYLQERTGIPASVILSQIILESGWGSSNITILKNNVMGIGNATSEKEFMVTVDLGDMQRQIQVRCLKDTTAFSFDSIADSIFYYVYVLLQSPENEEQYGDLRQFIAQNKQTAWRDSNAYRTRVLQLIAQGYHSDPQWYETTLTGLVDRVKDVESMHIQVAGL